MGLIYMATSQSGNSYIGQTINFRKRKNTHYSGAFNKNSKTYRSTFACAIRKYGRNNIKWTILYEDIPNEQLNLAELCAIYVYDTFHNGYNETEGGDGTGGFKHTNESKQKISKAHTGKIVSEETGKRISEANRGRKLSTPRSLEYRRKISEANKQRIVSQETRQKMSDTRKGIEPWNIGIQCPIETRQKISNSHLKYVYKIIKPNSEIEIVKNLRKYCLENNLDAGAMYLVVKNKRSNHKGYMAERQVITNLKEVING